MEPYTLLGTVENIFAMYGAYPELLGGDAGVGNFVPDALQLTNGNMTVVDAACLFYNVVAKNIPGA